MQEQQQFQTQTDSPLMQRSPRVSPVEHDSDIDDFLNAFARALTTGDIELIKKIWAYPAYVIGEEKLMLISSDYDVARLYAGARESYNSRGIFDTRPDIKRVQWVADNLVLVESRWPQLDKFGEEVGEETSTYTLKKEDDGNFKIHVVVVHAERKLAH